VPVRKIAPISFLNVVCYNCSQSNVANRLSVQNAQMLEQLEM